MIPPETRYTQVRDSWIAYQTLGEGPVDLVFIAGIASNIETMWDFPAYARTLERMASYSRLILFDPRGFGVSDPLDQELFPTWEHTTEDLAAVLNAARSRRAALLAQFDGGFGGMLFAAMHPDRTAALILWTCYARGEVADDYPIGYSADIAAVQVAGMREFWGTTTMASAVDPSLAGDSEYVRRSAKYIRTAASPGRAAAISQAMNMVDLRKVLPSIRVPTLVMHRANNVLIPTEWGRYVAEHIPGARYVELSGTDLNLYAGGSDEVHDRIEEFLTGTKPSRTRADRVLATVLFTDIVGSTERASTLGDRRWKELLAQHDRIVRDEIESASGRIVNTTGDGVVATFAGPGRAIRCAHALGRALEPVGLQVRAGLHTGEIELRDGGDIGGIAVHIASRVMGEAGPREVVCSRTVKDLVAGSEFAFADRGMCTLKGVPDQWQLFAVERT